MGKALYLLLQLMVYLDIMLCTSGCVIGDVPDVLGTGMNQSEIVSGFYLNLNSSAQCNGEIVSWVGCYYYLDEGTADTRNTRIELDVGIWRPTMDGFKLIGNLSKLTIPPLNPSYTFICQTWDISCEDRLRVQRGDVIGVYLSSTETRFKVLGSVGGASVYRKEGQRGESIILNEFNPVDGYSLYIEAAIEQGLGSGSGMDPLCLSVYPTVVSPVPTPTMNPTESTQSAAEVPLPLPLWAVYVIALMGSIILVLVVVFLLVLCVKCVTAKRRKEQMDIPGEHLPMISEDNAVPLLCVQETDIGVKATAPIGTPQANAAVLSTLSAELQVVVTETQDCSGSKVGSNLQHNGATNGTTENICSVQHATLPLAKPRNESPILAANGSAKGGTVQRAPPPMVKSRKESPIRTASGSGKERATPPMAKPRKESPIPTASGSGKERATPPIAKPRRGILNSTASDCSEAGSVQHATPPTVQPRRDIPIPKPRVDLSKKAATADSGMSLVVDRKNVRRSKSECDLLCQHLPIATLNIDNEAQRYSELSDSYPYVIHSSEMQSLSISLPDLRKVPLLPPRGASVSSAHGSSESLYATPHNIGEPQPYLEFQPIYSYAYAKVPLKYRTIAVSNRSGWNKELSSPRRTPGLPPSVPPRTRNANKLTDDEEVGKGLVTSHAQGQRSESDPYMVDSNQLNPLSMNLRDRNTNVRQQASGEENQLTSPEYAEIDSPLRAELQLGFNHFHTSPPVGGTTNPERSAKKQEVSNPRSNSPSHIQETTQSNTREWSPKPGKVVKFIRRHNGLHSSKSEQPSAGYQVAADSRKMISRSSNDYENDGEFIVSSSNSQHYTKLNESTKNRKSMPYARPHGPEQYYMRTSNHTSTSDDEYDHLNN